MTDKNPIGFIDSGVGGLTVVKEALRQLPNEKFLYLGDTARCPYGPRPPEQVLEFTWQMTNFLLKKKIKLLVIACNTATAVALDAIKKAIDIPVVGVIVPGSRAALKASSKKNITVIGTEGTILSHAYRDELKKKVPSVKVSEIACPRFAPIVESNQSKSNIAQQIVKEDLEFFQYDSSDTLIMGCTHYPLLRGFIQETVGQDIILIDSGAETISEVSVLLDYYDIANSPTEKKINGEFYTTGSPLLFEKIAKDWLLIDQLKPVKVML